MKQAWAKIFLGTVVLGLMPSFAMAGGHGGFRGGFSHGGGWGRVSWGHGGGWGYHGGSRFSFSLGFGGFGWGGYGYCAPYRSYYYDYCGPRYYYPAYTYTYCPAPVYVAPAPRYYYRDNCDYYYDDYRPRSYFEGGFYYRR